MKRFAVVLLSVLLHEAGDGKRCAEYGKRNGGEHSGSFEQY